NLRFRISDWRFRNRPILRFQNLYEVLKSRGVALRAPPLANVHARLRRAGKLAPGGAKRHQGYGVQTAMKIARLWQMSAPEVAHRAREQVRRTEDRLRFFTNRTL